MKIAEVLAKCGVESDEKARRVANVAPNTLANISADEIENGVTIERLETIGAPILKYSGQITIHGKLPSFDESARPGGYKAVFQNQNGSVGVRYVALDAAKKKLIETAARYRQSRAWSASINSHGLEITGSYSEKADCIAAFESFPRHLFAGGICAFAGAYGGYYVCVSIGAIYEQHVWPLIQFCFGVSGPADLAALQEAERLDCERKHAEYEKERKERETKAAEVLATFKAAVTLKPLAILPKAECAFVRLVEDWSRGPVLKLYVVRKKAFGQLCYARRDWRLGDTTFEPVKKMKRFTDLRASIEADMRKGLVFQAA